MPARSDGRGSDRGDDWNARAAPDRHSGLVGREAARGKAYKASCKADDGDNLAARALRKFVNWMSTGSTVVSAPARDPFIGIQDNMPTRLLRMPEAISRVGLGRSSIYRCMSEGRFSKRRLLGSKRSVGVEAEINA